MIIPKEYVSQRFQARQFFRKMLIRDMVNQGGELTAEETMDYGRFWITLCFLVFVILVLFEKYDVA